MRKILTNKANGATTYFEATDVEAFFLAGAHPSDYDVADEDAGPEPITQHVEAEVVVEAVEPAEADHG